jgi:hypothetical protein
MCDSSGEIRKGRYHGSNFWDLEGFAKDKWVVGAYIDFDRDEWDYVVGIPMGMPQEEIAEACVEYLNDPPKREKYEKKKSDPLYGNLSLYQHTFKRDDSGRPYLEVLLITDQKRNKYFWGKGKSDKF